MSEEFVLRILVLLTWLVVGLLNLIKKGEITKIDYGLAWAAVVVYAIDFVLRAILGTG